MKEKNKSFIAYAIRLNVISLVLVLVTSLGLFIEANLNINRILPDLNYVVQEYEQDLVNEDYEKIKLKDKTNSAFVVYDGDGNIVYAYNQGTMGKVSYEDAEFVEEYESDEYFIVYEYTEAINDYKYHIVKAKLDEDTGIYQVTDYANVTEDLKIIAGGILGEKQEMTDLQLELLSGVHQNNRYTKYTYQNTKGQERMVLFTAPDITTDKYMSAITESNKIWFAVFPTLFIIILIEILIYKKKLEKTIEPLNSLIKGYDGNTVIDIEDYKIAKEFKPVAQSYLELQEKNRKIEEEKNLMIASISHDLKTPLTAIKGYEQAFKDNIVPDNKKQQYMDAMLYKTDIANDLIESLFEFSKFGYSDYHLSLEETDLNHFTREYLAKKYTEIEEKGFLLEAEIPENKCICKMDKTSFMRVYDNLIENIFKYNHKNKKIFFKVIEDEETIKIIIADNGKGIPEDLKQSIFDPFITENEARELGKGTGLGLSIAKTIVKLHGGKICLNHNPIEGYVTEFDIELPKK